MSKSLLRFDGDDALNFVPKNTSWQAAFNIEEYRKQELRNMTDWANAEYDPEAKARVEKAYGVVSNEVDFSAGLKLARMAGIYDTPELWFAMQKKPIPQVSGRADLYNEISKDFRAATKKQWEERKAQEKLAVEEEENLARLFGGYVTGTIEKGLVAGAIEAARFVGTKPGIMDSLERANAAFQWIANADRHTFWQKHKPTELRDLLRDGNGEIDAMAAPLLFDAVLTAAQNAQGVDEIQFWRTFAAKFGDSIRDMLTAAENDARMAVSSATYTPTGELSSIAQRVQYDNIPNATTNPLDEKDRRELQYLSELIREFSDTSLKTNGRASWYVKAVNGAGGIAGESLAPVGAGLLAGGVGVFATAGAQAAGRSYKQRLVSDVGWDNLGNRETITKANAESFIDGVTGGAVESVFGLASWAGKGLTGKFLSRAATGGIVGGAAKAAQKGIGLVQKPFNKMAASFAGSRAGHFVLSHPWARVGAQAIGGTFEELVAENLVQSPIDYVQRAAYRAFGVNVDPGEITIAQDIAKSIEDLETSVGTLLFSLAMSTGYLRSIRRESRNHRESYKLYMASGLTERHARAVAAQPDAELATQQWKEYQLEDVVNDPEGAKERAKAAGRELMAESEAEANRVTGAVDVLMRAQGVGSVKEVSGEPGVYELTRTDAEGQETKTRLNEQQLDTWIQLSYKNQQRAELQNIQSRILGTQLTKDANENLDFVSALDMSELGSEIREDIRQNGGISMKGMKLLAERAAAVIDALTESGMSREEALASTDASVIGGVALGTVLHAHDAAKERVRVGVDSKEITKGRAKRLLAGKERISNLFRLASANNAAHSMLLYSLGEVTAADVAEDVHESTLTKYMRDNGLSLGELWGQLQEADEALGGILHTYEGALRKGIHAVEAFSRLSLSNMLASLDVMHVPAHVKAIGTYAKGSLEATRRLLDVGDAWNAFVQTEEGRAFLEKNGVLANVLAEAGNNVGSLLHNIEYESSSADAVLEAIRAESERAGQAEAESATPQMKKLLGEAEELKRKLMRAKNAGEAAIIRNELDNVQALIAAESGAPYVTPAYDWTARDEEGLADTAAMEANVEAMGPGMGTSLSLAPDLKENMKLALGNRLKAGTEIELRSAPRVLVALGERDAAIYTSAEILKKIRRKHGIPEQQIYELIEKLDDPVLVIRDSPSSYVFLLEMTAKNKRNEEMPVMAALSMKEQGNHFMLSAYALDRTQKIEDHIRGKRIVYSRLDRQEINEATALNNPGAPGLTPELLRLLSSGGFTEHTITRANLVKPQPPTDGGISLSFAGVSRLVADVRDEVRAIRQQAKKSGSYLKAPNGRESNLPAGLWELVRTVGFKRWFGDWINDPENASKVVDENGEPLVVYHGSNSNFTVFDPSKTRSRMDIQGMVFTPWNDDAGGYGMNVRASFLNLRNPANERIGYAALNKFAGLNEAGIKARDTLKSKDFDGVNNAGEEYIAFEPAQVKSATDNRGTFTASNPDITYSLSLASPQPAVSPLLESVHNARVRRLHKSLKKQLEQWSQLTARWAQPDEKVREGEAMEAFGRIVSTVGEVNRALPEGFRFNTEPYLRDAFALAKKIKAGEVTLSRIAVDPAAFQQILERNAPAASSKTRKVKEARVAMRGVDALMRDLLEQCIQNINAYEKTRVLGRVNRTLSALSLKQQRTPGSPLGKLALKRKPGGKLARGKMDADAYRKLIGYVAKMNADEETVQTRTDAIMGQLATAQTQEDMDALESELKEWSLYGNFAGMSLEKAYAMEQAFQLFVESWRAQWEEKLAADKKRITAQARKVTGALGTANPQELQNAKDEAQRTRANIKHGVFAGSLNFGQFLTLLKRVPGLQGFARDRLTELSQANVKLGVLEKERYDKLAALIADVTGIQSDHKQAKWKAEFSKKRKTGIRIVPREEKTYRMTIEDARRWVGLTPEQRKRERQQAWDDGETEDKLPPPESLTEDFANELALLGAGKLGNRKYISMKRVVVREAEAVEDFSLSRDQAAYLVLTYEQDNYKHNLELSGFGEEEMRQVYAFLGEEGLAIAHGLRGIVGERGLELARVYEEREGVPFPAESNYFRAIFEGQIPEKQKDLFLQSGDMARSGARYSMLIPRRTHGMRVDCSLGAFAVFAASQAETENYLAVSTITSDWRKRFANRSFADAIRGKLGEHYYRQLIDWVDLLEGAGAIEGASVLALSKAIGKWQGVNAIRLLAWNALTMAKQTTAVLHGVFAGEANPWAVFGNLAAVACTPSGWQSFRRVLQSDAFRARTHDHAALREMTTAAQNSNWDGMRSFALMGMKPLEKMDIWSNAVSMAALYESKAAELRRYNERNPEDALSEKAIDALCMESVERALELIAQPTRAAQKSAAFVGSGSGLHRAAFFLSSESVNKFGVFMMHLRNGEWGQAISQVLVMGLAEQAIVYAWKNLLLGQKDDDEDAWLQYVLGIPFAMFGSAPVIGEAIELAGSAVTSVVTGKSVRIYAGTGSQIFNIGDLARVWSKNARLFDAKKRARMTENDWYQTIRLTLQAAAGTAGAAAGSKNAVASGVAGLLLALASGSNAVKPAAERVYPKEKKKKKRVSLPPI